MIARETAEERKALPLATGVLDYFPDALLAVAECSRVGNDQHNPGQPLHWAKEKSTDEADALMRHLMDRGKTDKDGVRHSAKVAWRALALLQRELEAEPIAIAQNDSLIRSEDGTDETTRFLCGHAFGEEPDGCDATVHWTRVNGVEAITAFRELG